MILLLCARGQAAPIVDGNVIRVLSRLRAIATTGQDKAITKLFWRQAQELVDPLHASSFNQAMMELGATICTPKNPNCTVAVSLCITRVSLKCVGPVLRTGAACPVQATCLAYREVQVKARPAVSSFCVDTSLGADDESRCTLCQDCADADSKAPSAISYPLAKVKKAPRQDCVAVCVVSRLNDAYGPDPTREYLIIKRPAEVYLTPTVLLASRTYDQQLCAQNRLSSRINGNSLQWKLISRMLMLNAALLSIHSSRAATYALGCIR